MWGGLLGKVKPRSRKTKNPDKCETYCVILTNLLDNATSQKDPDLKNILVRINNTDGLRKNIYDYFNRYLAVSQATGAAFRSRDGREELVTRFVRWWDVKDCFVTFTNKHVPVMQPGDLTEGGADDTLGDEDEDHHLLGDEDEDHHLLGDEDHTLGALPYKKCFPVVAMSNFAAFQNATPGGKMSIHDETFNCMRSKIRKHLSLNTNVPLNILYVITAGVHNKKGDPKNRAESLHHLCALAREHMQGIYGDECIVHRAHFCDPDLEQITPPLVLDDADFCKTYKKELRVLQSTDLPKSLDDYFYDGGYVRSRSNADNLMDLRSIGREPVFIVTNPDACDKLHEFIYNNEIHVVHFVGGVTHWLNRQLKKIRFKHVLQKLNDINHKLVLSGNSAGAINLGCSTMVTAAKKTLTLWEHADPLGDLSDAEGTIIDTYVETPDAQSDPPNEGVDYTGLELVPVVFFPHYDSDWEPLVKYATTDYVMPPILRIADAMIVYIPPPCNDQSCNVYCVFADPAVAGLGNDCANMTQDLINKVCPQTDSPNEEQQPPERNYNLECAHAHMNNVCCVPSYFFWNSLKQPDTRQKTSGGGKSRSLAAILGLALLTTAIAFLN